MLVLHVLLSAILIQLAHRTNCYVRLFDSAALLLCLSTFTWTAHVSFINGHNGLLRNDNIIKVEVTFLHFLFLLFEILSPLM